MMDAFSRMLSTIDQQAADINQYAITWGSRPFRDAIAAKYRRTYGMEFDPEREITVCCGSTEGMIASLMAIIDPGDEVDDLLLRGREAHRP